MSAPYKHILVGDFETKWCTATGYTLTKLTVEEYVRDKRFGVWMMSYKWYGEENIYNVPDKDLPAFFASIDWSVTAFVAQNAQFDCAILSWIYDVHPCFIFDTLSMGRAMRGVEAGNSLKKMAEAFGLPPKGDTLFSSNGFLDFLPDTVRAELVPYCNHDVYLCEKIFDCLLFGLSGMGDPSDVFTNRFPAKELRLIDMTIKMFTEPKLVLDEDMLSEAIKEEREKRTGLLGRLGLQDADFASADKFADVLRALGVDPIPTKKSKTPPYKQIPAFAKTDTAFQALLNGSNEDVALACETRLVVRSTIERTRAQRFLDIAGRGPLPVPLQYCNTQTLRWAGSQQVNMQNMKRGSFLRKSIMAPKGYVIVVSDLSQIEPRVLAYLSDYAEMLEMLRTKDMYAAFGARMFGIPGLNKDDHPLLRQSAKSAVLGAGYQLGWASFATQLLAGFLGAPPVRYNRADAKKLGVDKDYVIRFMEWHANVERMREIPHTCSEEELVIHCVAAKKIIDLYRASAQPVVDFWSLCQDAISRCLAGGSDFEHKCLKFEKGRIMLPNGLALRYPDLRGEVERKPDGKEGRVQWTYGGEVRKTIHGGKLTENITSAVARCVMADAMLRVQVRYPIVLTAHDEIGVLVPEKEAEEGKEWIHGQMLVEPKYLPGIPLDATTAYAVRYGEAK